MNGFGEPALTPAQKVVVQGYLTEAEAAYHNLVIGNQAQQVRDQNGETITYTPAKAAELSAYINSLKAQLGISRVRRPLQTFGGRR